MPLQNQGASSTLRSGTDPFLNAFLGYTRSLKNTPSLWHWAKQLNVVLQGSAFEEHI